MKTIKLNAEYSIKELKKLIAEAERSELPKKWEDLGWVEGFYVDYESAIYQRNKVPFGSTDKNTFFTKEQAEASLAFAQLSQHKARYINHYNKANNTYWKADWNNFRQSKYCIEFYEGRISKYECNFDCCFLAFPTFELRDKFLENFRELILQAKPLMS